MLHNFSTISVASWRKSLVTLVCVFDFQEDCYMILKIPPLYNIDLPINQSQFESVTSVVESARDTVNRVSAKL